MMKKQMRACYQCDHLGNDERCRVSGVLECYYDPTEFGHTLAVQPKMRMFKQRKEQRVFFADFINELERGIRCLRCGRIVSSDVLLCDVCARAESVTA